MSKGQGLKVDLRWCFQLVLMRGLDHLFEVGLLISWENSPKSLNKCSVSRYILTFNYQRNAISHKNWCRIIKYIRSTFLLFRAQNYYISQFTYSFIVSDRKGEMEWDQNVVLAHEWASLNCQRLSLYLPPVPRTLKPTSNFIVLLDWAFRIFLPVLTETHFRKIGETHFPNAEIHFQKLQKSFPKQFLHKSSQVSA